MMKKNVISLLAVIFLLVPVCALTVSAQSEFFSTEFLRGDYKQVAVAAYINVKSFEIADSMSDSQGKIGYHLYRLTCDVKEIYKGKVKKENFQFYIVTEAEYPQKNLTGEKVVFLKRSFNRLDKKMAFFALENSTRPIQENIIEKMRKISRRKFK